MSTPNSIQLATGSASAAVSPITHVFVLMLENIRSITSLRCLEFQISRRPTTSDCNPYNGTSIACHGQAPGSLPTDPG